MSKRLRCQTCGNNSFLKVVVDQKVLCLSCFTKEEPMSAKYLFNNLSTPPSIITTAVKAQRGFGFLEVIISIAILGILSAGITPMLMAMMVYPQLAQANVELQSLRSAATAYYISNNTSITNIEQLRAACPSVTGNYTVGDNGTIVGQHYAGLGWNQTTGKWSIHRSGG